MSDWPWNAVWFFVGLAMVWTGQWLIPDARTRWGVCLIVAGAGLYAITKETL